MSDVPFSVLSPFPSPGYTGEPYQQATSLQFDGKRIYEPLTGRMLSQDPSGYTAGDTNLYRYAGNSPTNGTDPSGLELFVYHAEADQVVKWFHDEVGVTPTLVPFASWGFGPDIVVLQASDVGKVRAYLSALAASDPSYTFDTQLYKAATDWSYRPTGLLPPFRCLARRVHDRSLQPFDDRHDA